MKKKVKIVVLLLLPVLLEIFVFHFHAWMDRAGEMPHAEYVLTHSESLLEQEDGGYLCTNEERCYVDLNGINEEICTLYVDADAEAKEYLTVDIYGADEGNSEYYLMGSRTLVQGSEESHWMRLHFYGKAENIRLVFHVRYNTELYINEIRLNDPEPFFISWMRMGLMYFLGILFWLLRGKSRIWSVNFQEGSRKYRAATWCVCLALCLSIAGMVKLDTPADTIHQDLAEAFLDGRLYVDEKPPEFLLEMDNPYDFHARQALEAENGETVLWDYAFYNGQYYVYFGALPVLILYLPVYLLTGIMLRTDLAMGVAALGIVFSAFYLVREIFRRWFQSSPYVLYPVLSVCVVFGSGLTTLMRKPSVYEVCIGFGLLFVLFGIGLWISADKGDRLVLWKLFLGALCVACTAACRPQFLIGMFFGAVLFLPRFFSAGKSLIRKYWKEILCLCIPFLVVGIAVMIYNYVRFDSVFEFGSTYNLTTNDVTRRGWNFDRIAYGIYEYVLRPMNIGTQFPFVNFQEIDTSYLGLTIYEHRFGGVLWYNPLFFLIFGKIWGKKTGSGETVLWKRISICAVLCTLLVLIADINMGGILERYQSDFVWMLYLIVLLRIPAKEKLLKEEGHEIRFRNQVIVLTVLTVFLSFLMLWTDDIYDVFDSNLEIYTRLKYLFEFWR